MKVFFRLLLAVLLVVSLIGGCSSDTGGKALVYDIEGPVTNLDPQYATDPIARMIISNICEGLLVRKVDGNLALGVALSYQVSPDGKTYTFTLRQDSGWAVNAGKETVAVTAHDFVFAFQRIFSSDAPSPYAADFLAIKNSREILRGLLPVSSLGVSANGDYSLVITLEQESPSFPDLLASTVAMPCNREAFQESRGRYGLEQRFVSANGPFYVSGWSDKQISLVKNEYYGSEHPTLLGGVTLPIGRENPVNRFLSGKTDIAIIPYESLSDAESQDVKLVPYEKTTWCIVFNQNDRVWGNPLVRQGLAYSLEYNFFADRLDRNLSPTSVLVPPALLLDGQSYRTLVNSSTPLAYNPETALRLYRLGLESLELDALPATDFYVPDTGGHSLNMGLVQQGWQKNLAAYINIKPVPLKELDELLVSGKFQMMLMPFSPSNPRIETLLGEFISKSPSNYYGYRNPRYDQLLENAAGQTSLELAAKGYAQAEYLLLADAAAIPVYSETTYYAIDSDVSGVSIFPFGNSLYFKYGIKS